MSTICIDYETYSEVDLRKVGVWNYARHPSTEILCLAYADVDSTKQPELWIPGQPIPDFFYDNVLLEAHNSEFERVITTYVLPKYEVSSWHDITLMHWDDVTRWRCTAARAAAMALPRKLEKVAAVLGLRDQKDMKGHRVMQQLTKPKRPSKKDPSTRYTPENHPDKFQQLYDYCIKDVLVERELSWRIPHLRPHELDIWFLDQRMNSRGICVDVDLCQKAIGVVDLEIEDAEKEIESITDGHVKTIGNVGALKEWIASYPGHESLKSVDKDTLENLESEYPEVNRAAEIRLLFSRTSTKKLPTMVQRADKGDCRARSVIVYCGANATGRFAGAGIQPHNFPRGFKSDKLNRVLDTLAQDPNWFRWLYSNDVLGTLSNSLRGFLRAGPGRVFLVADYAAIEARVLAWLAYHKHALQMFFNKEDPYIDMAKKIYLTDDIGKDERDVGKRCVLGAGYQIGAAKFQETCRLQGVDIDAWPEGFAETIIEKYREAYYPVTQLWNACEDAAMKVIQYGGSVEVGRIQYVRPANKDVMYCILPSGRPLVYHQPNVEPMEKPWGKVGPTITYWREDSQTRRWSKDTTYGGKLTENACQAVARDVMAEAMLRIDDHYPLVLTVHDEIIAEPHDDGRANLDEFVALMSETPLWADGLPVNVEGWKGYRYAKN